MSLEQQEQLLDAEDDAIAALAAIFVGPHPPADASMDEQLAYADAVLDAVLPDGPGSGDPEASRRRWEELAARREKGTEGLRAPG